MSCELLRLMARLSRHQEQVTKWLLCVSLSIPTRNSSLTNKPTLGLFAKTRNGSKQPLSTLTCPRIWPFCSLTIHHHLNQWPYRFPVQVPSLEALFIQLETQVRVNHY